jgi:hypothetical protein
MAAFLFAQIPENKKPPGAARRGALFQKGTV